MKPTAKKSAVTLLLAAAIVAAQATGARAEEPTGRSLPVIANSGVEVGTATLSGGQKGVILRVEINAGGLTPGWHGLHFHAVGDCSDTAGFKKAKAHINTHGASHGLLSAQGPEDGDLPNLFVAADGSAKAEFFSQLVMLTGTDHALLDADGSALIIHASADDQSTSPTGNSGARVACAAIR